MPENLMNKAHKTGNEKYREGYDRTFRNENPYDPEIILGMKIHRCKDCDKCKCNDSRTAENL